VILCGLDIAKRVGLDPVATKMLLNLVLYSQSDQHELHPLITEPIIWGEYETEKGLVTDIYSGLLVSSTPRIPEDYPRGIVVTKEGYQLAGGYPNRFNTRPGIQYVANGRRPWGPFVQSFGGQPLPIDRSSTIGIGKFWCTIPADRNSATHLVWNPADEAL